MIRSMGESMDTDEQLKALAEFPHDWAVHRNQNVKAPFTSGDYVEWQLRRIFGPNKFSVEFLRPPELITVSGSEAYTQATVRLHLEFADGSKTYQDGTGIWPLKATRASEGGTLENTAAERYETALKAAITDGVKAAAERVGNCFRVLSDQELVGAIKRGWDKPAPVATPEKRKAQKDALFPTDEAEAPKKFAEVKGNIPDWQKMCRELANNYPNYQTQVKGQPSGQTDYMHILGAALKEGFQFVTAENYKVVIEAVAKRAYNNKQP